MNIDSIKLYSGFENKPKQTDYTTGAHGLIRESVEKCDKEKFNRGYYSGSFTGAAVPFERLGGKGVDKLFSWNGFLSLLRV